MRSRTFAAGQLRLPAPRFLSSQPRMRCARPRPLNIDRGRDECWRAAIGAESFPHKSPTTARTIVATIRRYCGSALLGDGAGHHGLTSNVSVLNDGSESSGSLLNHLGFSRSMEDRAVAFSQCARATLTRRREASRQTGTQVRGTANVVAKGILAPAMERPHL